MDKMGLWSEDLIEARCAPRAEPVLGDLGAEGIEIGRRVSDQPRRRVCRRGMSARLSDAGLEEVGPECVADQLPLFWDLNHRLEET